jgi:hypothetical protein
MNFKNTKGLLNQMIKNKFPIGESDFTRVVQGQYTLIDKTMFIREIMDDGARVILITRPRRFGKTLAMSMLEAFLSTQGADVFKGLNISKETEFCAAHQNKYPVISLSFKDCKYSDFDNLYGQIKAIFSLLYIQHIYLLDGDALQQDEKNLFRQICSKNLDHPNDLARALSDLIRYIKKHTKLNPILLLDEYDTPIHSAHANGFYDEIIDFMRVMLGSALKDNPILEKAVMTGITKVSQESMFSGLNNLQSYTMLSDDYGQYFGFTEEEVISILPEGASIDPIKDWYNGYSIGGFQIYNPWSIINCLKNKMKLMAYWVGTSDNALVYELIQGAKLAFKERIEKLICGDLQDQIVQANLTFSNIQADEDAIWTLLIHAGYLNVVSSHIDDRGYICAKVGVPNKEVMQVYQDMIKKWFTIESQSSNFYDVFLSSVRAGNVSEFVRHIQQYIMASGSCFDFSANTPERIFHVFILGLLMGLREQYDITSDSPAGLGRADMVLIPKTLDKQGVILEFKVCKDQSQLQETAAKALTQIVEKKYPVAFLDSNVHDVLCIGMAFCGKEMAYESVVL